MRRRRSGDDGRDGGQDEPGRLEIGLADRRLDRLMEEENRRRAQSADAGVRSSRNVGAQLNEFLQLVRQ